MGIQFSIHNELISRADGDGYFFAKKGCMIADVGRFAYEKRLLDANDDKGLVGNLINHVARKVSGENLELMEVRGSGTVYMSDNGEHNILIDLEPNEPWNNICVESESLLAFTPECRYGVKFIGTGVISQKGLMITEIKYREAGAQVIIKSNGNPLILEAPCRVDPDTLVAWTGDAPSVSTCINWKTIIGHTSGESYMFEFHQPGQQVIIQPIERISGLNVSIDDKRYTPSRQH